MISFGNVPSGSVLPIPFGAYNAAGASVTLTGLAITDVEIYKGTSMTQRASDAGVVLLDTDGIDIDGTTGIHGFSIDTGDNTDAGFYTVGSFFSVVVSAVTIDSQTVNFVAATFRIIAAETVSGTPKADVSHWLGTAAATPTVAGVPEVDITHYGGSAGTFSGGRAEVNVSHAAGVAWGSGAITAAAVATGAIDADALAADAGTELGTAVWATATRTLSSGAIVAATFGAGAIDAAAIAADAIGSSELAATAVAEIADQVWDEILSGHAVSGSTGEALSAAGGAGDPWITALPGSYSAGQAGFILGTNLDAPVSNVETDTQNIQSRIPAALTAGRINANVGAMEASVITATAIATDAITSAELDASAITEIQSGLATAAGVAALNNLSAAQVNAEVVDALNVDTYAEPGQGAAAATTSLAAKLNYLYKAWRNRKTQTATQFSLYGDDAVTVDQKSTVSDDGVTFNSGEISGGP